MKRILYICTIFCLFIACTDDAIEQAGVSLEVRSYVEQKIYTFGKEQGIYLWTAKKWADNSEAHVKYIVDQEALDAYNKKGNANLKLLPESCYTIEKTDFIVTDDDRFARFKVMCSPEKILEIGGNTGKIEYALAFSIELNGQRIDERYGSVIVGINIEHPYFSYTGEAEEFYSFEVGENIEVKFPYIVNFVNNWWINMNFKIDDSVVEAYNQKNSTNYRPFPVANVSWDKELCILEKEKKEGEIVFIAKTSESQKGITMLAIQLLDVTAGAMVHPEKNQKYCFFINVPDRVSQTEWRVTTCKTWIGKGANLANGVTESNRYDSWIIAGEAPEYFITYALKDQTKIAEMAGLEMYWPTDLTNQKGQKAADIFVSMDSVEWKKVSSYTFQMQNGTQKKRQKAAFMPIEARYVKMVITDRYDNYVSFSEIYINGEIKK